MYTYDGRLLITFRTIQRDPWATWTSQDHPVDTVENTALYHFLVAAINKGMPVFLSTKGKSPLFEDDVSHSICEIIVMCRLDPG